MLFNHADPVIRKYRFIFHISLLLDFDFMATRAGCQPQNAFSNCISRSASRGSVWLS